MPEKTSEFLITVHEQLRLIEVVYPSHPTDESFTRYTESIKDVIRRLRSDWNCLVDQRALKVAPPEMSAHLAELNLWGKKNGMRKTARIVADSAISELQARRIAREAQLAEASQLFKNREDAWAFLVSGA